MHGIFPNVASIYKSLHIVNRDLGKGYAAPHRKVYQFMILIIRAGGGRTVEGVYIINSVII